jgi:two-component system, cell cycle response regulator
LHNMQLRVLVADDDDAARRLLEVLLDSQSDCVVRSARNGQEALELALEFMPHVLVTDWHMPVMDGIDLCQALRSSEWGQGIYILMLTGAGEEDDLVAAFEAGVDDYLVRPVNRRALSARLHGARRYVQMREAWVRDHAQLAQMAAELTLSNKRFKLASHTDPLTEVSNRRAGLLALNQAWSSATRRGSPLAVISIDIDHFKRINDTYGHGVGDAILQYTASTLRKYSRAEDTVCRWGGEEFLVISPNVGQDVAMRTAERLRLAIEHSGIDIPGGSVAITVSLGVACWELGLQSVESLLSNADAALYEAKGSGRNKTVVHSAEPKDR